MKHKRLIERANIVVEALPYIRKFYGKTFVIKYGGSAMVDDNLKNLFAKDIVLLKYVGINPVIIHGGGKEINRWLDKIGKKTKFINGLRVTDKETMEIAEMVLTGKINQSIVTLINQAGGKAVGLSGKDGGLIKAKKLRKIKGRKTDLGFVGEVKKVNSDVIRSLDEKGFIPVISSVGVDEKGQSFNLNADYVASEIAQEMQSEKLFLLTDVKGILDKNGKLIHRLNLEEGRKLLKKKFIGGGMIPKLFCALKAIKSKVKSIHIIDGRIPHSVLLEVFTNYGIGTMINKK